LIAAPTVRNIATYAAAFGCPPEYTGRFGSFQIWYEVNERSGSSGCDFQKLPPGP
jgi:hypothetical protein